MKDGLEFYNRLGYDNIFTQCGFNAAEKDLCKAVILGRLISPGSELHTYKWLKGESMLSEFLPTMKGEIPFNPLYLIGDKLYNNKDTIENKLRENTKALFPGEDKVYLYDLTNTYFESNKSKSNICKRGKSKEKRADCPLVTLALVVDQNGFPVYSKIFKGNQSEPATLAGILKKVYEQQNDLLTMLLKPAIVMDRGIATKNNIAYLEEHDYSYFVIERKNDVKNYEKEFSEKAKFTRYETSKKDWILLRKITGATTDKVLVISSGKTHKEKSIVSKKEKRFLEDANKLITSNQKGSIKDYNKINIRIGRLKERYGAITNSYSFVLIKNPDNPKKVKAIKLASTKKKVLKKEYAGHYVIRTNKKYLTAKEIWDFYMNLTGVEASFRSLKSELGTRPVYHQKDDRIEAHLFISVLAYYILRSIIFSLNQKDYHKSWSEIRNVLKMHIRSNIYFTDRNGNDYQVRMTGKPEEEAKKIYDLLKIKLNRYKIVKKMKARK
jgi:transposase